MKFNVILEPAGEGGIEQVDMSGMLLHKNR